MTPEPSAFQDARHDQPVHWPARRFVLLATTAVALYLCYRLTIPLLPALTWAFALAVLARPLYSWIRRYIQKSDYAALASVTIVTLLLVIPAGFVTAELVRETSAGMEKIQEQAADSGGVREWLLNNSYTSPAMRWMDQHINVREEFGRLTGFFADQAKNVVGGTLAVVIQLLIMLFALFYFFRDRDDFVSMIRSMAPLSDHQTNRFFKRVKDTVEATLYGRLAVAALQGALGGLMFWWLGLPTPVLWGTVMAFLAVIPWLGAFVIWVPAAVFLALQGDWGKAAILTAWGMVVIGLVDNLLYPVLVGSKMRLHSLVIFVALIGGLAMFGAAGIVIGPLIVSVTDGLLDLWRRPPQMDADHGKKNE